MAEKFEGITPQYFKEPFNQFVRAAEGRPKLEL